jgi:hypothetical protein
LFKERYFTLILLLFYASRKAPEAEETEKEKENENDAEEKKEGEEEEEEGSIRETKRHKDM